MWSVLLKTNNKVWGREESLKYSSYIHNIASVHSYAWNKSYFNDWIPWQEEQKQNPQNF